MVRIETELAKVTLPDDLEFQERPAGDDLGSVLALAGFQLLASFRLERRALRAHGSVVVGVEARSADQVVLLIASRGSSWKWESPREHGGSGGTSLFQVHLGMADDDESGMVVHCLGYARTQNYAELKRQALALHAGPGLPSSPRPDFHGNDSAEDAFRAAKRGSSPPLVQLTPRAPRPARATDVGQRFIQSQTLVARGNAFVRATRGLVAGKRARIVIRIAAPDADWKRPKRPFPTSALPPGHSEWKLVVCLSEPHHLGPEPLLREIVLPRVGDSSACDFEFEVQQHDQFEARISILYEGRVIQTAVLAGGVVPAGRQAMKAAEPELRDEIKVISNLAGKRPFDLAYVLNHTAEGAPLAVGMANGRAWISSLDIAIETAADINDRMRALAASAANYEEGIEGVQGLALLIHLAQQGGFLYQRLVEDDQPVAAQPQVTRQEFVQVTNTRSESFVPFEFLYSYQSPDKDAELCPHWRSAVESGACPASCDHASNQRVCPMGFWALQKVIERHEFRPKLDGAEAFVQAEPSAARSTLEIGGVVVVGASERVAAGDLDALFSSLREHCGMDPKSASSWETWRALVRTHGPNLLLALPHTSGQRADAALEIGRDTRPTITFVGSHVRPTETAPAPVLALFGCDAAGTAEGFASHVSVFRRKGAAIVLSTTTTVLGAQAVTMARLIMQRLAIVDGGSPIRLGEAIRALKREAILNKMILPLCLVAFGDADWYVTRKSLV